MAESLTREYVSQYDPENREDRRKLVNEMVAMANAAGGIIYLGVEDDGRHSGLVQSVVDELDPARIAGAVVLQRRGPIQLKPRRPGRRPK